MNNKRLKEIEGMLKSIIKPKIYKYYKLRSGKYLLIEPCKAGLKTEIELIFEGEESATGRVYDTLKELMQENPGAIDGKSSIDEKIKSMGNIFE